MQSHSQPRRRALVTGAADGIGRAVALALAHDGFDLVLADLSAADLTQTTSRIAQSCQADVVPLALDLRNPEQAQHAIDEVIAAHGVIDVLVNNAGVALRKPALDITVADWDAVIGVNLNGTFFVCQQVARHLVAAGRSGAIINVASTYGLVGYAGRCAYGVSKGGLVQMTRMLAIEWAPVGIRVNAVAPATVETPSRAGVLAEPLLRKALLDRIPMGRFGTVDDVAQAVAYLGSPKADFITGQVWAIDGGLTAV